ncbi:hypothetical protein HELRODRAFT_100515 [Helobdella robusta]|uniref:Uncharacterized protein n=1 Tax=Helobdella robusta TaxID=6412 RepID=T1ED01_HELRO|nr:hypothetical protein HELRODRAFT_100515 [Helobdella robusta]ESO01687.1 hypothetical protein HELRODRAFT_100515 [Helobdella robusta]
MLATEFNDLESEMKTQKRHNAVKIKDLTKQLQTLSKRLNISQPGNHNSSVHSDGVAGDGCGRGSRVNQSDDVNFSTPPTVRVVQVNKQMLIDKIVSLQKTLAKKNERMEFLYEHNIKLTHELANKAKIIKNYVLKEEAGVMSTNQSDRLKLQMTRRGGIMASLFSSQQQDEGMTVDLALEICHKLQSVLEDTLLKNIALKESIEVLGQQVEKLTKESQAKHQQ